MKPKGAMTNAQLAEHAQKVDAQRKQEAQAKAWEDSLDVIADPSIFDPLYNGVVLLELRRDAKGTIIIPQQYKDNNAAERAMVVSVGPGSPSQLDPAKVCPCSVKRGDVVLTPDPKNLKVLGKTSKGALVVLCQDTSILCRIKQPILAKA